MQVTLSVIGKLKDPPLKALYNEYKNRLEWKIDVHELESKSSSQKEGDLLLKSLPPSTFLIILDEKGENLKSEEFATLLKNIQIHHQGKIAFVMRAAILHLAFAGLGALEATSGAWHDNTRSMKVSEALGYEVNGSDLGLRRGRPERQIRLRLPLQAWERTRRDDIQLVGLEPCLELFGAG